MGLVLRDSQGVIFGHRAFRRGGIGREGGEGGSGEGIDGAVLDI